MAISLIGATAADTTSVSLPGSYGTSDLIIIFAFSSSTTTPTLPAGWTNIANSSSGASAFRCGYKLAVSNADTSGTWTNAVGVVCHIYRGIATNQTPVTLGASATNTSSTVNYGAVAPTVPYNNWIVAFAGMKTTSATLSTPPTNLTNQTNLVGASNQYAGHDSNGGYSAGNGAWPSTNVSVGTSAEYRSITLQVHTESLGYMGNDYQFAKDVKGAGDTGILSFGERIR